MPEPGVAWVAWVQILGSVLTSAALLATAVSVYLLSRQAKTNERVAGATIYQNIVAMGNVVDDMHRQDPNLYGALFDGEGSICHQQGGLDVSKEQRENAVVFFSAMKWLNYFDMILTVSPMLPKNLRTHWISYVERHLRESSYLRCLVLDTDWYGAQLASLCKKSARDSIAKIQPPSIQPSNDIDKTQVIIVQDS